MLSERQSNLLFQLAASRIAEKSSVLAGLFNVSIKTIRHEIKLINQELPQTEQIQYKAGKGYCLSELPCETVRRLRLSSKSAYIRKKDRASAIMAIVIFEEGHISMESLGSRLYLSKSAICKELEEYWRFRELIEVSARGLRSSLKEEEKRFWLAKFFSRDRSIVGKLGIEEDYAKLEEFLPEVLRDAFIRHWYIAAGSAFYTFTCYILVSILRSRAGFVVTGKPDGIPISSLMKTIRKEVAGTAGYFLDGRELENCQKKLNELNVVQGKKSSSAFHSECPRLENQYRCFVETVKNELGIDLALDETRKKAFILHLYKMNLRIRYGYENSNLAKREINRKYPMTAHIMGHYGPEFFGKTIPDTEMAFLIAYFAAAKTLYRLPRALLVSDLPPALVHLVTAELQRRVGETIEIGAIIPAYVYVKDRERFNREQDLILTTEPDILFNNTEAVSLKDPSSSLDIDVAAERITAFIHEKEARREGELSCQYLKNAAVTDSVFYNDRDAFLYAHRIKPPAFSYDIVLDNNILFLPDFDQSAPTSLRIYDLKHPFRYKGRNTEAVIVSRYNRDDGEITGLYRVIRSLLDPRQLRHLLRSASPR
jgi:transcriptional antiterminator